MGHAKWCCADTEAKKHGSLMTLMRDYVPPPYSKNLLVARPHLKPAIVPQMAHETHQLLPAPLIAYIEGNTVKVRDRTFLCALVI